MATTFKSIMSQEGFIINYSYATELPSSVVMKLVLDSEDNVKGYPSSTTGEVKALLVNEGGDIYSYISAEILDKLEFDDNGFIEVHPLRFPTKVSGTKKFTLAVGVK